ncbi:hypothetical protein Tco_1288699, partial [Tanacetum coccineum]
DHILQGCGIDGADSDYGYALDRVRMSLPEFDLRLKKTFSNKDADPPPPPPKRQNVLAYVPGCSEIVKSLGSGPGGKHACVDLTGVYPLVGLKDNGFVAVTSALKAESSKVAKHGERKLVLENQTMFIPFRL